MAEITQPSETEFAALTQSFLMIIVSEIGDKTFLIAAILAMRHDRLVVFTGAFGSLVVMSILSAAVGHLLPTLIPRAWTQLAAAILFLVFGVKMLLEAREMEGGSGKMQEEMKEVEEEIEEADASADGTGGKTQTGRSIPLEEIEEGGRPLANGHGRTILKPKGPGNSVTGLRDGARNFANLFLGPVFVQAFVLTFLGEWGDRSQISTIALAAAHNVYVVTVGTVLGHSICTAIAVLGGRWLSTKISVKHVTLGGAILFLAFAFIYLYESWTSSSPITP